MSTPVNDFVPFCSTDTGSNLIEQAAYLTDSQLAIGNQPGIARLTLVNKALRQATYMGAALAQYLVNTTGVSVNDNGDTAFAAILATMASVFPARGAAFSAAWTAQATAPGLGTPAVNKGFSRRIADTMKIDYFYYTGGTPTSGSGTYFFAVPGSQTIDTTKIGSVGPVVGYTIFPSRVGGGSMLYQNSGGSQVLTSIGVYAYSTTQLVVLAENNSAYAGGILAASNFPFGSGTNQILSLCFKAELPIVGW